MWYADGVQTWTHYVYGRVVGLDWDWAARYHFLQFLVRYLVWRHKEALVTSSTDPIHCQRVSRLEWGRSWFQRSVCGRTLFDPIPVHRQLIHRAIDWTLWAEWSKRWSNSQTRRGLRGVFPRADEAWMTLDAVRGGWATTFIASRFLVRHCHIGIFCVLWDPDERVVCPWCGDDFTHHHFICLCRGTSQERLILLKGVGPYRVGDLEWLASHFGYRIGQVIHSDVSRLSLLEFHRSSWCYGDFGVFCVLQHSFLT